MRAGFSLFNEATQLSAAGREEFLRRKREDSCRVPKRLLYENECPPIIPREFRGWIKTKNINPSMDPKLFSPMAVCPNILLTSTAVEEARTPCRRHKPDTSGRIIVF
ncbi:hypothetical protein TNCV_2024191 [Trichonephila clavipes]|nr:hypothetical protein TNCV_2024191 [Trichonephila clavipes]